MMDATRLAYLEAMGIDVWQPRGRDRAGCEDQPAPDRIVLREGASDILCIAESAAEADGKLAADISRAMRCRPVWGWPADAGDDPADSDSLQAVVGERLITRVVIFGRVAAGSVFGRSVPDVLGAARVHLVPGLKRLGNDRDAKRILWKLMCDEGIAAPKKG